MGNNPAISRTSLIVCCARLRISALLFHSPCIYQPLVCTNYIREITLLLLNPNALKSDLSDLIPIL